MVKSTLREIKTSIARYLAILMIVALGVGFYAGLKMCKPGMRLTASHYLDNANVFSYELMSSYGIDDESIELAEKEPGVTEAEGSIQFDAITDVAGREDNIKWIAVPEKINRVNLKAGRMPENADECLIDDNRMNSEGYKLGQTIRISKLNKSSVKKNFKVKEFTIVGAVNSPLYLDYQRGQASVGDGSLDTFAYVPGEAFNTEYFTSLYVTLDTRGEHFSDELEDELKDREKAMKSLAKSITSARRESAMREAQKTLDENRADYEEALSAFKREKAKAERELSVNEKKLRAGMQTIADERGKLKLQLEQAEAYGMEEAAAQLRAGLQQLDVEEQKLAAAGQKLAEGKKKAQATFREAEAKLDEAKKKLDEGQAEIDDISTGNSYAISRENNAGYSSFKSNSEIVENISKVFPLFFFLVAALVCMTTMTRMIDEQRTQIGVLKALGYSNAAIMAKYLFYSGSASAIGAVIGFFAGCKGFPIVIWKAYTMMYTFSEGIKFVFDPKLLVIMVAAALACSMGATLNSLWGDTGVAPAELIRPKTPPAGKRILLERIPIIWDRLSFLYKVSFRNIFRYKKRFLMMVLGISGCTALLIAGFGLDSTISKVAEHQYNEISLYDYQIVFEDDMTADKQDEFLEEAGIKTRDRLGDIAWAHSGNVTMIFGDKKTDVTTIAADSSDFNRYIKLADNGVDLPYPGDGEIIVAKKVQKALGVEAGDEVTIKDGYKEFTLKVSGICDYYVGENVFLSLGTYKAGIGRMPEVKTAYVLAPDGLDDQTLRDVAAKAAECDSAITSVVNLDMLERVAKMMKSLNLVIYAIILSAGLLAFIVLYNLTNINIMERIREIATIKVLGFNQLEVSQYVFRENIFLTGIAAIVGMPLGRALLNFAIDKIAVSMIYFQTRIDALDYIYSVLLTFVFAFIVNLAMQKRLRDVSMTESLKSIE